MLNDIAIDKIETFVKECSNGVEFDELDNQFQLLINSSANGIASEDSFDEMFVGEKATVKSLFYKQNGRYYPKGNIA